MRTNFSFSDMGGETLACVIDSGLTAWATADVAEDPANRPAPRLTPAPLRNLRLSTLPCATYGMVIAGTFLCALSWVSHSIRKHFAFHFKP